MSKNTGGNHRFTIMIAGALLILAAAFLSPARKSSETKDLNESENMKLTKESSEMAPETEDAQEAAKKEEMRKRMESAEMFLLPLHAFLKSGDLAQAAAFLEKNKDEIDIILRETFDGKRYLIGETGVSEQLDGGGAVLVSASVVFYGTFKNGMPEGKITALQSMILGEPRYDYTIGSFENGKMNGPGMTGYIYYEKTDSEDGLKTEKAGVFKEDLMEGEVRYTCIGNSGDSTTWHINAVAGVTQIDERWKYDADKAEYVLISENDKTHAYILKEKDALNEIWRNRIVW